MKIDRIFLMALGASILVCAFVVSLVFALLSGEWRWLIISALSGLILWKVA